MTETRANGRSLAIALCLLALASAVALSGCGGSDGEAEARDPYFEDPAFRAGLEDSLALFRQGDLRGALKPAVAALLAAPQREEPYARISMLYDAMGADDEAAAFFGKTTERFPDSVPAHRYRGYHEFRLGNWANALAAYRRATELAPQDAEAHFRLGLVLQAQGDFDEAVVELRRAHDLAPTDPVTAARLARVLRITGDYDGAYVVVDEALQISPRSPDLLFASAQLDVRGGRPELAEKTLRRAIAEKPDHREAHEELAKLLQRAGREDEGRREAVVAERLDDYVALGNRLRRAVAQEGGDPVLMLALAELELTERRVAEAERWLARAEERGAPAARVAIARAEAAFARGDVPAGHAALADLDAMRLDGADAKRAELARAAGLVAEGRLDAARDQLAIALDGGPEEREWLRRAADLYAAAGDLDASDRVHERAARAEDVVATFAAGSS